MSAERSVQPQGVGVDIASWLRRIGLEQYEQAFRDNAIDAEVLPELTDADLEKLGVLLGHRRRLLKAIAERGQSTIHPTTGREELKIQHRDAAPAAVRVLLTVNIIVTLG